MTVFLNWLSGWRRDLDGWLVRARRQGDPSRLDVETGDVGEWHIAARTHGHARAIDKAALKSTAAKKGGKG